MKNGIIAFGFLAAAKLVTAQSACLSLTSEFPACAFTCVSSAASAVGCTNTADLACQCNPQSSAAIQGSAINCVLACGGDAAASALKAATDICNCVATATQPPSSSSTTLPGGNSATPTTTTTTASASTGPGSGSGSSSPPPTTSCPPVSPTTSSCAPGTPTNCGSIISEIPACAQPCFISAAPQVHCSVGDYACQCQPDAQASLSPILQGCIATACPLDSSTLASIKTGASSLCACATAPVSGGNCTTTATTSVSTSPCSSSGPGGGSTETQTVQSIATVTCSEGCGEQSTGGTQPGGAGSTAPIVVPTGAGSRYSIGRVGDFIGAFWFAAVAL